MAIRDPVLPSQMPVPVPGADNSMATAGVVSAAGRVEAADRHPLEVPGGGLMGPVN